MATVPIVVANAMSYLNNVEIHMRRKNGKMRILKFIHQKNAMPEISLFFDVSAITLIQLRAEK